MKKISFTIFLVLFFIKSIVIAQEMDTNTIKNNLKLQGEMGFITKDVGFPFLYLNRLIDTTNQSNEWNKIISSDTIGKYFRIDSSDHYLLCLPKSLDFFRPMYLFLEMSSNGQIIKKEIFNLGKTKWNNYYKYFIKFQNLFSCSIHRATFQFYTIDKVYFTQLVPLDSIDKIREYDWRIYNRLCRKSNKENTKEYNIYKTILEKKNNLDYYELTCYYYLQRGYFINKKNNRNSEFRLYPFKRKIKVKYTIQNNKVKTKDQFRIKQINRFMKISYKRIRI